MNDLKHQHIVERINFPRRKPTHQNLLSRIRMSLKNAKLFFENYAYFRSKGFSMSDAWLFARNAL